MFLYPILLFVLMTYVLYAMHWLAHRISFLWFFHESHHKDATNGTIQGRNWKNIFLFFDNWKSTGDQWLHEIIPIFILSAITGEWWLIIFYYIWAAFIQETIRHNPNFNFMPWLTSGKFHLVHHVDSNKNYGVFVWWWDKLFGTYSYDNKK